jgi:short-subunit dehydrogenase
VNQSLYLAAMNIVITGASRGIGKAIAERFAVKGSTVILNAKNKAALEAFAGELKQRSNANVLYYPADLSVKSEAAAFGKWCLQQCTPDILVNNAGTFLPGSIHDEEEGTLEKMIEVNLYSAYHLTRLLLPKMIERKSGHIFNMCSIASLQAYENGGSYSISKFALAGFSRNLREEMKAYNIKVTAVYPGAVYTDSWAGSGVDPERIMEAKDIAEMIYASAQLSPQACVEEIVIRPVKGDL